MKLLPPKILFVNSLVTYHDRFKTFIAITAFPFIATLIMIILSIIVEKNQNGTLLIVFLVAIFVMIIIQIWSQVALYASVSRGLDFSTAFQFGRTRAVSYVGAALRLAIRTWIGLILLIVPGIIWSIRYGFATIATVVDDLTAKEAMRTSRELTVGHFWAIVWRFIILGLINTVVILPTVFIPTVAFWGSSTPQIGVGVANILTTMVAFFVLPLNAIYTLQIYNNLKQIKASESEPPVIAPV